MQWGRAAKGYKFFCTVTLSSLFLFITVNLALHFFFKWKGETLRMSAGLAEPLPIEIKYSGLHERLKELGVPEPEILLRESYGNGLTYEAFTGFKENTIRGKWVNVDPNGFRRHSRAGKWPLDPSCHNIFVFGGSTTFGYGVVDDQTIPAQLQEILEGQFNKPVRVYNFGRSNYYSTSERILFEQLLMQGHRPDMAIFIDGLNDFHFPGMLDSHFDDIWKATVEMDTLTRFKTSSTELLSQLPVLRVVRSLQRRLGISTLVKHKATVPPETPIEPAVIENVLSRYLWNKNTIEQIATKHGIRPLFVWQPIPSYGFDLKYHPFFEGSWGKIRGTLTGYPIFKERITKNPPSNFLWLADLQTGKAEPLYVDLVHYAPQFSQEIARQIAAALSQGLS